MSGDANRDHPARWRHPRHLVIIVFLVVWGLITHGSFAGSGDEPHYLIIAHSLAFDGDLDLANNYREATLVADGRLQPEAHARWHEGTLRPVHDIGMPLALAPVVGLAYVAADRLGGVLPAALLRAARLNKGLLLRHQLSLLMALLAGLLARELYLLLRAADDREKAAFLWALLFALSPPILSHAFLFFTEIPTALATLIVFRRLAVHPVVRPAAAAAIGTVCGLLLLVHARNVGLVAGLCIVAVLSARERRISGRAVTWFLGGVAAGVAARTAATYALWGTYLTTPHAAVGDAGGASLFVREMLVRATGLLFDREYGLFAYAPIYLLIAPALMAMARLRDRLTAYAAIVIVGYLVPILLPVTNVHGWTGGWSPAARFLVPVAALLWIPVYQLARQARGAVRAVVAWLVVAQVLLNAYLWQSPRTLWNDGDGTSALAVAGLLPTWAAPGAGFRFAAAMAVVACFGFWGGRRLVRRSAEADLGG